MQSVLLSVHVLAGILFVGGSAVAVSLFPRYAKPVPADGGGEDGGGEGEKGSGGNRAVALLLHRITRVYGALGLIVPTVGIVLALTQDRMTEVWVVTAMVLTAVAGGLLALQIYPRQRDALASSADSGELRTLKMLSGIFNLLWTVVVVLMIVRPGA